MPSRPNNSPCAKASRWITPDPDAVAHIVEAVLREEAWWTALRSGKYAQTAVVWADGVTTDQPRPAQPAATLEVKDPVPDADLNT